MKRLFLFTIVFFLTVTISSCTKDVASSYNSDGEMVLVNLSLSGEVGIEETPLTKAFTTNDLIGVQVYQGSSYYAYGLFDDESKMNIYLHSGKTYKFVCTVVKNGKNIVYFGQGNDPYNGCGIPSYITTESGSYILGIGQYGLPFLVLMNRYKSDGHWVRRYSGMALNNEFNYNNQSYYDCLQYGAITSGKNDTSQNYPKADRFYGEVSGYKPTDNASLSIPMKRVGFGLTLSVSGITDGNVTVTIKNTSRTFANNNNITEDKQFGTTMWSFFDLKSAWQYADNYTENFTVGVIWTRSVGVTQDLGTKTVQFKRNEVNHVKINLNAPTRSADLSISLEEPEVMNESYSFGNL